MAKKKSEVGLIGWILIILAFLFEFFFIALTYLQ